MTIDLLNFERSLQFRSWRIIGRHRAGTLEFIVVNTLTRLVSDDWITTSFFRSTMTAIVLADGKRNSDLLEAGFTKVRYVVNLESGQIGFLVVPVLNLPALGVGDIVHLTARYGNGVV